MPEWHVPQGLNYDHDMLQLFHLGRCNTPHLAKYLKKGVAIAIQTMVYRNKHFSLTTEAYVGLCYIKRLYIIYRNCNDEWATN
jgi:hypothetical protein